MLELLGIRTRYGEDLASARASGLFDEDWYRRQLKGRDRPTDLVAHYLVAGAGQGLDPHPLFDTARYAAGLARTPDAGRNPLAHYQASGDAAGRNPSLWFDGAFYRATCETELPEDWTALRHYWETGRQAERSPHPLFEQDWYRERYGAAIGADEPILDLVHAGLAAGRVPHRALDGETRIAREPAAINRAVETIAATEEPRGPRRVSMKNYDLQREKAFLDQLAAAAAKSGILADPPLVSIITPTRNRASLLPTAIRSVLAQDYANWELIIVDDGSEDDTEAVVGGFDDPRIRYLKGSGKGAADARNIGMAAAGGSFFAYLDSDNQWTPHYLTTMVAFVLRRDLDLAYSAMKLESEEGIRYRGRPFDYDDLVELNYVDLNAVVHRRALTERHGGFDTSLRRMMDWDLVLRYAKGARVDHAPFIGVLYDERKEGDRITTRESSAWRYHLHNRYMIDWPALAAAAPARDPDLVSIVIPIYGKYELTNGCLESLFRHAAGRPFEIVIVNNKSDRATFENMALWAAARDGVELVASFTNLNFALSCNVGFARTRGQVVVFLNNDTLVTDGWLAPLAEEVESGAAGAVQPKLLYPDDTVQSFGAVFSEAGVISHILYRGEPRDAPHVNRRRELQAIHGACLAVRAEDFIRLRGFDPLYVNG
ncbi:MAG: glycosyltransferase, partial [Rhizobiales bacterium]|nr:glycosyltransferase [Hyphomicrobiales bacterium]